MGSPVSPIVANLFMSSIESICFANLSTPPRVWFRYVDDTFVILKKDSVTHFHELLNNQCDSIKFTMELESPERTLSFLDCFVRLTHNKQFSTSIYRKPTHTDLYLHYQSAHPFCVKRSIIQTLFQRAERLCSDPVDLAIEKDRLTKVLLNNGFPKISSHAA